MSNKSVSNLYSVWHIAEEFSKSGAIVNVREFGGGIINDTFLITMSDEINSFILQRINSQVFTQPHLIIQNIKTYTSHVERKLLKFNNKCSWVIPYIRTTRTGQNFHLDNQGNIWRGLSFIKNSRSYDIVQDQNHAFQIGYALGCFHSLVSDLDIGMMNDTLIGFHVTPNYIQQYYDHITLDSIINSSPEIRYCHQMIANRRAWADILEKAKFAGWLPMRIIHGDPKVNNFMIDNETGQAISLVDLDTVKPGLIHYDIGDCLRSSCNTLGEDTIQFSEVRFETDLAHTILKGYLSIANKFLTYNDYVYLYDAIRLLTFELGVRFFQDYLVGNIYFKVRHPAHNLERAIVQFKLTESIEKQEHTIRGIIKNCRLYP